MMYQDLEWEDTPCWAYFCQISELDHFVRFLFGRRTQRENHLGQAAADTPKFIVESDATIVAPLIFAYVLGW